MSVPASTLRKLASLALNAEQMAGVLDILADGIEAEESRKQAQRERTRRAREKQRGNVTVTAQSRHSNSDDTRVGDARVEDKTSIQEIEPPKTNTHAKDLGEFRAALAGVCDGARIEEFVKLRRKKRGALTGHAAGLFLRDAEACQLSVPDAIDTCIRRNWITVQPEFLRGRARDGPPSKAPSMSQILEVIGDQARADQPGQAEDRSSFRAAIPHLRAVGSG